MPDAPKRKRGPGGGRKLLAPDDPTRRQYITMPESMWATARALGAGNASAGIRRALTNADTNAGKNSA